MNAVFCFRSDGKQPMFTATMIMPSSNFRLRSETGASVISATVLIAIAGIVLAGLNARRGQELRSLVKQSVRDGVERGQLSTLMQAEDMLNSDFGCVGGFASLCSELYVRRICRESAPAGGWSAFANAWWAWAGGSAAGTKFIRVLRDPVRSSWQAQDTANGAKLTLEIPFFESGMDRAQLKELFTSGRLPGEAPEHFNSYERIEDCIANAMEKDGDDSAQVLACGGTAAPQPQRQKSSRRSMSYQVDLTPGTCSEGLYQDVEAKVSLADMKGFDSALNQSTVSKSMNAKITLNTLATSVSCQILGPADGKEGQPAGIQVMVNGPASGVRGPDGTFGFAARGPGESDAVIWTKQMPIHFASPTTEEVELVATVFDENLQPAGNCSLAIQQADIPYPPPTCTLTISQFGNSCVLVAQSNRGKVTSSNPPSVWNCGLVPRTTYSYAGSVTGPGGSGSCTASLTTADFLPESTPEVTPPMAQIAQVVRDSHPPAEPEPVITIIRTRFGRDPAGQCYKVEVLREKFGPSSRQFERTEQIPCASH